MAERDKVVPLRIVEGGLKPEHRCVLSCHCGSTMYELAGDGRGEGGQVRCARCRCIKSISWRFEGALPEPV
jgi:hypothetical protein